MKSGIYKILNLQTNDFYIGSAKNLDYRFNSHKSQLERNKHKNIYLQRSFNKYGANIFEFHVLEYCEIAKLIEREQYYIDSLKPRYNLNPIAGSNLGRIFGPHSEEHKKKISLSSKGRKASAQTKLRMSAWQIGRKMSDEAIANMIKAKKGNSYRRNAKAKEMWPHDDGCECKCEDCFQKRRNKANKWYKENKAKRKPLIVNEVVYV